MSTWDFGGTVRMAARELLRQAVDVAIAHYTDINRTARRDVSDCVVLAGRLESSFASGESAMGDTGRGMPRLTPGTVAVSDYLTEVITPGVEQVRQALFESSAPPFTSYAAAAAWIEETGQQQPDLTPQERARLAALQEYLDEWSALRGEALYPSRRMLPYVKPDNAGGLWLSDFTVRPGSPLDTLEQASQEMAQATGFPQHSVVTLILIGKKPLRPPFSYSIQTGFNTTFGLTRVRATIEVSSPEITEEEFLAIRRDLRQIWQVTNTAPLGVKAAQLLDFVQQRGGVPPRGMMRFWDETCAAWNTHAQKVGIARRFKNGKCLRMAYKRAEAKRQKICPPGEQWLRGIESLEPQGQK